jgi:hypothetical protein
MNVRIPSGPNRSINGNHCQVNKLPSHRSPPGGRDQKYVADHSRIRFPFFLYLTPEMTNPLPGLLLTMLLLPGTFEALGQAAGEVSPAPASIPAPEKALRVDVRQAGARGDGVTDDGPAIRAAIARVSANGSGTLYFPAGSFRCGRESGTQDGIKFVGISNVTIEFDPGAELVMDNLNPDTGLGDRGHGVVFSGVASNIKLINVKVRWAHAPSQRSAGDGFHFLGLPVEGKTLSNISLVNCRAQFAPQAGAIFMGCSHVEVTNFESDRTLADGLHFNACQNVTVKSYHGLGNRDDGLAFVTYYAPPDVPLHAGGPYSLPDLGPWNDTGSSASDIKVEGGIADGVRIAGASNITLTNIQVDGKESGIIIDSGRKDPPRVGWSYLASKGINIANLKATHCGFGLRVLNHNVPATDPSVWWRFGVTARDLHVETSTRAGIDIERCTGIRLSDYFLGTTALRKDGVAEFDARPAP